MKIQMLSINLIKNHYFSSDLVQGNVALSIKRPIEISNFKFKIFNLDKC